MTFQGNTALPFKHGDLFLGLDENGREVGLATDRHAITIAGARSGKGACAIIPNLLRWPHNTLVVDPKGENAERTWKERMDMGAAVHVLDPFQSAEIPDQIRASFNPLADIDPDSLTAREDILVIADGLVKRSNPKDAQWDDGAVSILAGIIAFVVSEAPDEHSTLTAVRDILIQDRDSLKKDATQMLDCHSCGGLARAAGVAILETFESNKGMETDFVNGARRHTSWLDSEAMKTTLGASSFNLSELKTGNASVYVVLPPQYLETHSAFMRLLVRCAINVMAAGGSGKGEKCLFILDEFFSLGRIDEIAKSCGLMPSYGVHLWPFLQDLGQLLEMYGTNSSETFFANADVHQYFGNTDPMTLQHVSQRLGVVGMDEMPDAPDAPAQMNVGVGNMVGGAFGQSKQTGMRVAGGIMGGAISGLGSIAAGMSQAAYQNAVQEYQREMSQLGKPRYQPEDVAKLVQRSGDVIVPNIINFVSGVGALLITPAPYFRPYEAPPEPVKFEFDNYRPQIIIAAVTALFLFYIFGAAALNGWPKPSTVWSNLYVDPFLSLGMDWDQASSAGYWPVLIFVAFAFWCAIKQNMRAFWIGFAVLIIGTLLVTITMNGQDGWSYLFQPFRPNPYK